MDTTNKSPEHSTFLRLRRSIASTGKDITFLSKCRKERLTHVSYRIRIKAKIPQQMVKRMEMDLIKGSIRNHHAKQNKTTLECYVFHLKLAKEYPERFPLFLTKVKVAEEYEAERKRKILDKKLSCLRRQQKTHWKDATHPRSRPSLDS